MSAFLNDQHRFEQEKKIVQTRFMEAIKYETNGALWKSFEEMLKLELDELTVSLANGNSTLDELRFIQGRVHEILRLLNIKNINKH